MQNYLIGRLSVAMALFKNFSLMIAQTFHVYIIHKMSSFTNFRC